MCAAFLHSEYYQRVRLPSRHLHFFGCASVLHTPGFRLGTMMRSPRFLGASISAVPCSQTPPDSLAFIAICECILLPSRSSTLLAPGCCCYEAQSLHLRYGPDIALSTLNSYRYLHEPKTRFLVRRLFLLPGWEFHPLKAPGLAWRTKTAPHIYWFCANKDFYGRGYVEHHRFSNALMTEDRKATEQSFNRTTIPLGRAISTFCDCSDSFRCIW